jgi:hypothetical protein
VEALEHCLEPPLADPPMPGQPVLHALFGAVRHDLDALAAETRAQATALQAQLQQAGAMVAGP